MARITQSNTQRFGARDGLLRLWSKTIHKPVLNQDSLPLMSFMKQSQRAGLPVLWQCTSPKNQRWLALYGVQEHIILTGYRSMTLCMLMSAERTLPDQRTHWGKSGSMEFVIWTI